MTTPPPRAQAVRIRNMAEADLGEAVALSEGLGWPHRLSDWQTFSALGDGRVALVDDRIVAVGRRWLWGDHAATVGLLLASQDALGSEAEAILLENLCSDLGRRSVLFHAHGRHIEMAAAQGFVPQGELTPFQGRVRPAPLTALPEGARLRPAGRSDLSLLVDLDRRARGVARDRLIEAWLGQAVSAIVLDHDDGALGFAILRRFGRGAYVGPVCAADGTQAQALIGHLCSAAAGRFVRIDVVGDGAGSNDDCAVAEATPDRTRDLADVSGRSADVLVLHRWLESLDLTCENRIAVMVRGDAALLRPSKAGGIQPFAIAAQALG